MCLADDVPPVTTPSALTSAVDGAVAIAAGSAATGIHKIAHVVVIMQENRSFDTYFGTYPGADGIPMMNGVPTVCVPEPASGGCDRPFHNAADLTSPAACTDRRTRRQTSAMGR